MVSKKLVTSLSQEQDQGTPDYGDLCTKIMDGLKSRNYQKIYDALAKLSTPAELPKLLNAWNLISPRISLFDKLKELPRQDLLLAHEWLMGQVVKSGELMGITTETFYFLHSSPSEAPDTRTGKLLGYPIRIRITGKALVENDVWYRIGFPKSQPDAPEFPSTAWVTGQGVKPIVSYDLFMAQLRNFEMIHSGLSLQERITLLRQMSHSKSLIFDQVIGTKKGEVYKDTRPDSEHFYQFLGDAQTVEAPSGELIDLYHLMVALDVYRKDRIGKKRSITVFGIITTKPIVTSDTACLWAGDIGAAVVEAYLNYDDAYEATTGYPPWKPLPESLEAERVDHYYRIRAPEPQELPTIDAWAVMDRVEKSSSQETIAEIIESIYGRNASNNSNRPKLRKTAIQKFMARHGLKVEDGGLSTSHNLRVLKGYVIEFADIWLLYRRSPPLTQKAKEQWENAKEKLSTAMVQKFLFWLDDQARRNELLPAQGRHKGRGAKGHSKNQGLGKRH